MSGTEGKSHISVHGGRNRALLQVMHGDCQLLNRLAPCEFLLKMLYSDTFLLSGRKKMGHISWFLGLHVNPFQAPSHTGV